MRIFWVGLFATLFLFLSSLAQAQTAGLGLTWSDTASNEDGVGIERKLGTTGTFAEIARVGVNVTTYSDTNLAYSTQYCYRLYAYNTVGKSGYSPEGCGTTKANPIPSTPGKPTVTPLP